MRKLSVSLLPLLLLAAAALPSLGAFGADDVARTRSPTESPWPVRFSGSDGEFVVYPPRFAEWRNGILRGSAAVSVQPRDADQASFGMVWISAHARHDAPARTVGVSDVEVEKADFPAVPERNNEYAQALRENLAAKAWTVTQERLESDMSIDRAARQARSQPLNNNPPRIVLSQRPAVLVPIDGSPVLRDVEGTQLLRVVNTRALLLLDKAGGRYYLRIAGRWMSASSLDGAWSEGVDATGELERARQVAERQGQVDQLDEGEDTAIAGAPDIYVAAVPTELLQTDGPPEYSPIEGTRLLYVANSPDSIFLDLRTQDYFVLISGRWYRAADLVNGRWVFVPGSQLPADFAMIPSDHPAAVVRASVPGTPQAREAVIASETPQIATIRREAARIELTYDGEPEFRPIEGTALHYAANAPIPVIRVSADAYYALDNGVWFTARSPYGTWSVASYVPAAIYGIPASSPLHYVTYVRIYHDTEETVDVGYTSGYVGSYVSTELVVVYGSGWYHRPWIGYYWYGSPFTWGYGFSTFYTWWYPWGPPRFVAWRPYPCYRPWWGPWAATRHGWIRGSVAGVHDTVTPKHRPNVTRIYDRWGTRVVARDAGFRHRPDRAAPQRPLRSGEGYIVKDGRRIDIAPSKDSRRPQAWRDEDRAQLPAIQKTRPSAGEWHPGKPDGRARELTPRDARAAVAPRMPMRDADSKPSPQPRQWVPQRDDRDGRPDTRAVPERRSVPETAVRRGSATGLPAFASPNRETRTEPRRSAPRNVTSVIERRDQLPSRSAMPDRDVRDPGTRGNPDRLTLPGAGQRRSDGAQMPLQRQRPALPQREAITEPQERDRPQSALRDRARPQIQREAREFPRLQREQPRRDRQRDGRDRG